MNYCHTVCSDKSIVELRLLISDIFNDEKRDKHYSSWNKIVNIGMHGLLLFVLLFKDLNLVYGEARRYLSVLGL